MLIKQAPTTKFRLGLEKQGLQIFENAEVTMELPLKNGRIVYQLTDEEKKIVEDHYGMKLDDPDNVQDWICLLYTSPSPRDQRGSRMPSSA